MSESIETTSVDTVDNTVNTSVAEPEVETTTEEVNGENESTATEESDGTPNNEGETVDDTGVEGGDEYKKNASSRIQELIERSKKSEAELAELKSKFEAEQKIKQESVKPFYELDMVRINNDMSDLLEQEENLKLEGRAFEAAKVRKSINDLIEAVELNDKLKTKWLAEQETKSKQSELTQARVKELDDAAAFYQKNMNIPDDVWQAGSVWLETQFKANPILGKKFADIVDRQGSVAAVEWAHTYAIENMGKEVQETKATKEAAKSKNIGGTSTTAEPIHTNVQTFADLMKLSSNEIVNFEKENPKRFKELVNAKLKRS